MVSKDSNKPQTGRESVHHIPYMGKADAVVVSIIDEIAGEENQVGRVFPDLADQFVVSTVQTSLNVKIGQVQQSQPFQIGMKVGNWQIHHIPFKTPGST